MKFLRRPLYYLAAILLVVLITGCNPSESPEATQEPNEPMATEPVDIADTPVPEDTPEEAKPVILRFGMLAEPDCMGSHYACLTPWDLAWLTWETFQNRGANCEPIPQLAKSMELSEDNLTWTLHLQEGVTWSDGEPFNAYELEEFWKWVTSLSIKDFYLSTSDAVSWEALDENTFQFTTSLPLGNWLKVDSWYHWPVPMHIWGEIDEMGIYMFNDEFPVTTGPFMLTEWEHGSHMVFDANPNYWGGEVPIDRLVVQFYGNDNAMATALLAGEIDAIGNNISPQFYDELASASNITLVEQSPGWSIFLSFNVAEYGFQHPAVKDPKVREAIEYAVDRQRVVDISLLGQGILCPTAWGCGPLYEWGIDPEQVMTPHDPGIAAQILEDAGYSDTDGDGIRETPDGNPLVFRIFFDIDYPPSASAADIVSESLSQVGIGTEITAMEHSTLWATLLYDRDFDLTIMNSMHEFTPGALDWQLACYAMEIYNYFGYCSQEFDDVLFQLQTTIGQEAKVPYVYQMNEILAADRPFIYLAGINALGAFRNDHFDMPTDACPVYGMLTDWYAVMNTVPVE